MTDFEASVHEGFIIIVVVVVIVIIIEEDQNDMKSISEAK